MNRYDIEATFYDNFYDSTDDIPLYLEYASKSGGTVLECACGTGRLLLPLARAGHEVTGLDASYKMLEVLKTKLRREEPAVRKRVHLVKGDMRDFKLPKTFAMGYIAFASFLHNLTVQDEELSVKCMFEHLQPDGLFVVDVFNPDLSRPQHLARLDKVKQHGKETILLFNAQEMNFKNQTINATNLYDFVSPSGSIKRKVINFQLRYIFKDELVRLLERAGFRIETVYGGLNHEPFNENSTRIVCVARK